MLKNLVIVESPAKAKTIRRFLGRGYEVKASMGHVRDLPKSQFGIDIENNFEPKYITIRGKGKILKALRDAVKKSDKVFLAADPDREGEAISWHLVHSLDLSPENTTRVQFNEITRESVRNAFKHPRKLDIDLVNAQQARRLLDRIVGYKLSPLLWRKVRKGLSAGRVQSVVVRLIVDREEEIEAFKPEEYWTIDAILKKSNGEFRVNFYGNKQGKLPLPDKDTVDAVLGKVKGDSFTVLDVKKTTRKRHPAPPFTTSTLQQEASRRLNFSTRKTMRIAQELYEGINLGRQGSVGLITYMRTDSTRIAKQAQESTRNHVLGTFGPDYVPTKPRTYRSRKGAQEAHEAIRPTDVKRTPDSIKSRLKRDQYRLYKLIWMRFVKSQMTSAVYDVTNVEIGSAGYIFRGTGSRLRFPGFLILGNTRDEEEKDSEIPELEAGEQVELVKLLPEQHFTKPPARYTEASLVKTLEEKGIGRPSTYSPIIETIQQRGYVTLENRSFVPTELGRIVVRLLKEHFAKVIDEKFTAELENQLDDIEAGKRDWVKVLDEFYDAFKDSLDSAYEEMEKVKLEEEATDEICEDCGRHLVIKHGRYGKFLACPGFPECRFTKPLVEETGAECPLCAGGKIIVRRSKRGRKFYGCSNYPECKFVTWYKPTKKSCPKCGTFLVEVKRRSGTVYKCAHPECDYEEAAKRTAGGST